MLNNIIEKNPEYKIYSPADYEFKKYGRVLKDYDFSSVMKKAEEIIKLPTEGVEYQRSVAELEVFPEKKVIESKIYGSFPVQIGWCNGHNNRLNALEYHKGNEVLAAITDLVLILGELDDVVDNKYNTDLTELFYVSKGTCVELFSTTLHFAPVSADENGFKSLIILPEMTNAPFERKEESQCEESKRLWMRNKWMIAHPDSPQAGKGAYVGLTGENITIKY